MKNKKPDLIVYNENTGMYDAAFRDYPTNLGAPNIEVNNIVPWKRSNIKSVNERLKSKFEELKLEYEKLVLEYEQNKLIYNSKFQFEPVVGQSYHLYKNKNHDDTFLSIIKPNECEFNHLGSFRLSSDKIWERL